MNTVYFEFIIEFILIIPKQCHSIDINTVMNGIILGAIRANKSTKTKESNQPVN